MRPSIDWYTPITNPLVADLVVSVNPCLFDALLKQTWLFESKSESCTCLLVRDLIHFMLTTLIRFCHPWLVILSVLPLSLLDTLIPRLFLGTYSLRCLFHSLLSLSVKPSSDFVTSCFTSLTSLIGHSAGVPCSDGLLIPIYLWFVATILILHTAYSLQRTVEIIFLLACYCFHAKVLCGASIPSSRSLSTPGSSTSALIRSRIILYKTARSYPYKWVVTHSDAFDGKCNVHSCDLVLIWKGSFLPA